MRFLAALLALTATAAPRPSTPPAPTLLGVERIWGSALHNGSTDLARFKDRWYCAFREGQARNSRDGAVRILSSDDGLRWAAVTVLSMRETDLRFPQLSVTPDRRLMLTAAAHTNAGTFRGQSLAWFTSNGRDWGDAIEIGEANVWLWRLAWQRDHAFTVGYTGEEKGSLRLYQSRDGLRFDPSPDRLTADDVSGETSLVFLPDQTVVSLLDLSAGGARVGLASPPYRAWSWRDSPVALSHPHLLYLPDGRLVAAGTAPGERGRTTLYWLDPAAGALKPFLELPCRGAGSAPGLVYEDGTLWVSYESAHEGKIGVYIARVKL